MINKPEIIVVTLMTPQGTTGVQTHFNQIINAAISDGVKVRLVHPYEFNWFARKVVGLIIRLLRPAGDEWVDLWGRWAHYQILKYKLRQVLTINKDPVVLYAQDPLSTKAALAARTNKNTQRVASVIHFNVAEAEEYLMKGITKKNSYLYNSLVNNEKNTLPKVDKLIFVSQFMQDIIHRRLPSTINIPNVVIHNFIEGKTQSTVKPNIQGDIVAVGTLEPRKNQSFILKVLATCKARGKSYSLTIIGDGQDRATLEQLTSELGLTEQVTFLGFIPNAIDYMASHKVFAHSAVIETMGIAPVEALSYSLPIIAAPVGGIPEVYTDGQEGFYWSLNDIEGAADKLCELLENKALYALMAKKARSRFEQHFSKKALASKWLNELITS
jgi:glycosyltransferase involved in cell wall biosynthesis